jgi:hypothetical protein
MEGLPFPVVMKAQQIIFLLRIIYKANCKHPTTLLKGI